MAEVVYLSAAVLSALCGALLFRGYRRSRVRLLLWSAVCFIGLAANNALLFVDLVVVPELVDLSLVRLLTALVGMGLLVYSLVWESA
jgi:hypothetical protein